MDPAGPSAPESTRGASWSEAHAARDTVPLPTGEYRAGGGRVGLGGGPGPLCGRRLMGVAGPISKTAVKSLPRGPRVHRQRPRAQTTTRGPSEGRSFASVYRVLCLSPLQMGKPIAAVLHR